MKNMRKKDTTKNYSNNPIGEWKIGEGDYFISFALTHKPNFIRRFFAWAFFGLRWIDFPKPKDVKDITPSKGMKIAKVVGGQPQRRFKG
jgi:hypothetical protein